MRSVPYSAPAAPAAWDSRRGSRPLLYLTLGTAFGTPELLATAIEGPATLDAHVVVAAGRVRPEQLGDLPDNVTVWTWVPQADLLPARLSHRTWKCPFQSHRTQARRGRT